MSILHVFPGQFNRVDIEQVRLWYTFTIKYLVYVRTACFNWQLYINKIKLNVAEVCLSQSRKTVIHSVHSSVCGWFSMTFQAWKISILNSMTFQDLYASCLTFLHARVLWTRNTTTHGTVSFNEACEVDRQTDRHVCSLTVLSRTSRTRTRTCKLVLEDPQGQGLF